MKTFVAAAGLFLLPASAYAGPTFNGSFEILSCRFSQMVVCQGEFCMPDNSGLIKSQVTLNYANGSLTIQKGRRPDTSRLQVVEVSEAKFGGTLWVRSRARIEGEVATIQTTYQPRGAGAYSAVGALHMKQGANVGIMSGSCNISRAR